MGMRKQTEIYLNNAIEIISSMEEYWPLTLRQIYYQLVAQLLIRNALNEYQKLSRVLSKARLDGAVPWKSMEDRSRSILYSGGYSDINHFKKSEEDSLLTGYRRDLLQTQAVRPEIWVEKDALSHLVYGVASDYCIDVVAARGFSSMSFKHECRERILRNLEENQLTKILYFGDLDPSGWEMLPTMMKTLKDKMNMEDFVTDERIALNLDQVEQYNLPHSPDALKLTDTRAKKYLKRFGNMAVELDALKPEILQSLVKSAIETNLNMELFEHEKRVESRERIAARGLTQRILDKNIMEF